MVVVQELRIAFDVLFSNAKIQSQKPVVLNVGSILKIHMFATEKEITVVHGRSEAEIKGVADLSRYPRCMQSYTPSLQTVFLEPHPIHVQDQQVSTLLVYIPKPASRQSYLKLRTNYRYILTLGFSQPTPPNVLGLEVAGHDNLIKAYAPELKTPSSAMNHPPPLLKPLALCGPNPFLEHTFQGFQTYNESEGALQNFLIRCHSSDGPLNVVKWARYSLYDLNTARFFCDPTSPNSSRLSNLFTELCKALEVLWSVYCTTGDIHPSDPYHVISKFPPLYSQIIPLCANIYTSPYALAKKQLAMSKPIAWPHGAMAYKQLSDNGFTHAPTILQEDRAVCRHCSFTGYAWRRLLPPQLHHMPTCVMLTGS